MFSVLVLLSCILLILVRVRYICVRVKYSFVDTPSTLRFLFCYELIHSILKNLTTQIFSVTSGFKCECCHFTYYVLTEISYLNILFQFQQRYLPSRVVVSIKFFNSASHGPLSGQHCLMRFKKWIITLLPLSNL